MMHPDDALRLISELDVQILPEESSPVRLEDALGRVLAKDLPALVDQPPFDKASMDGFAWGGSPAESYTVVETIAAGSLPTKSIHLGECSRIMTGAPLPVGAGHVQRVEWTTEKKSRILFTQEEPTDNVIRRGANQKFGDLLLSRRILRPVDIGILAFSGYAEIPVQRRPVIGVLSTGDELRPPGGPLAPGSIYDSNGHQLCAHARSSGCEVRLYGRVPDREDDLDAVVRKALAECDLFLLSGGVSMGDFDYVPRILVRNDVEELFHYLALKPGKPTFLGRRENVFVLGLPGNPVATFVNFEIFVRALLARLRGLSVENPRLKARLAASVTRETALDRVEFLPARLDAGTVSPLRYTGSSMLNALADANVLIRMEIGQTRIEEGSEIDVRPI
jgi:molybdopterin molybdotransferase